MENSDFEFEEKTQNPGNRFKITDFKLIEVVGHGKFGKVWFAIEKQKKFRVAIKTTKKQALVAGDLSNAHMFHEMYIHSQLDHPHIIKFLTYFHDDNLIYFVLEYAENGTLFSLLRFFNNRRTDESTASTYCRQTAEALIYIHSYSYLHGDLKPENLLLDGHGNIKISDFGYSWPYVTAHRERGFCGTMEYLAPEILAEGFYDFSVDNWSLGVLTYELLVGKSPFAQRNKRKSAVVHRKILNIEYDIPKYVSAGACDLIRKLLAGRETRLGLDDVLMHPWITQSP